MRAGLGMLAWAVGATTIAALTLEATVRVDDWAQFGVSLTSPAIGLDELAVRDSLGFHARAGTSFRQFRVNALGFRGPEVHDFSDGRPIVIAAGASETFGLYETAGKEWPRQLADSLTACGAKVHVLNAAFAGMSLPTVRQDFERRLRQLQPDMVLYYPTPMQYLVGDQPKPAQPVTGPVAELPAWRSRALPRFRDAVKRGVPQPLLDLVRKVDTWRTRSRAGVTAKSEVEAARLSAFEEGLRTIVGTYRAAGTEPVLVVHANRFTDTTSVESKRLLTAWERFYPAYTGTAIVRFDAEAAERTLLVGRDSGVVVVDPRASLLAAPGAFSDFSHFNDAGAAIVGGLAARAVAPRFCANTKTDTSPPLRSPR